ncbi:MAG: hypothetical protein NTW86_07575 [Candidatus Sumerlaeota bacterium]|nr:hypothetical protein [Candidatus Sumerlaeota bacterium]
MNVSQVALRLREQMQGFLRNLPVCKTARRFALEALYGIQTRQSLQLSEIGRSLNESIALIKTEDRLSRQASRAGLDETVRDFVIGQGASRIGERTLLVVDGSDIAKPYAAKMEYLARVRDGSAKALANGYWLCQVVGVECGGAQIVPLVNHLWSQEAPKFRSENAEILSCVAAVARGVKRKGIWGSTAAGTGCGCMWRCCACACRSSCAWWAIAICSWAGKSAWPKRSPRSARCRMPRRCAARTPTARKRP